MSFNSCIFFSQTLLLREWRRLITKRDWPVLIKLWTGKMNIEIKLHISFQITVNISGKKRIISVDSPSTKRSVSIVWLNRPKKQSQKTLISSHAFLRILVQSDLINKLMWIRRNFLNKFCIQLTMQCCFSLQNFSFLKHWSKLIQYSQ